MGRGRNRRSLASARWRRRRRGGVDARVARAEERCEVWDGAVISGGLGDGEEAAWQKRVNFSECENHLFDRGGPGKPKRLAHPYRDRKSTFVVRHHRSHQPTSQPRTLHPFSQRATTPHSILLPTRDFLTSSRPAPPHSISSDSIPSTNLNNKSANNPNSSNPRRHERGRNPRRRCRRGARARACGRGGGGGGAAT